MPTTVKITALPSASASDITSISDVLPIIDGNTTKQITVDNLFGAATHITSSGIISSSKVDSEFSLIAHSASFNYISASTAEFDANTIFIGGTSFTKTDVDNLKAGKSIATDADKKFVNSADTDTYIRMGTSARAWHYISGNPVLKLGVGNIIIGDGSTTTTFGSAGITGGMVITGSTTTSGSFNSDGSSSFSGSVECSGSIENSGSFDTSGSFNSDGSSSFSGSVEFTGSIENTGSFDTSGSFNSDGSSSFSGSVEISGSTTIDTAGGGFTVNNLLDLLTNYGQAGLPTGSGEGGVSAGDINLDGQVNITDLLLLLAGYGNPNCLVNDLTIPINTNYQLIGPEIKVSQSVVVTVPTSSFFSIT
jgi:hypothetical protein